MTARIKKTDKNGCKTQKSADFYHLFAKFDIKYIRRHELPLKCIGKESI